MIRAFLIALIALPLPAYAELCDEPQTQKDINYCAEYNYTRADAELNDAYAKFKERLVGDNTSLGALKKAQRAWLSFRDAECELETIPSETGSSRAMVLFECKARLTKARTAEFETRLTCTEGDFTCFLADDAAD